MSEPWELERLCRMYLNERRLGRYYASNFNLLAGSGRKDEEAINDAKQYLRRKIQSNGIAHGIGLAIAECAKRLVPDDVR